MQDRSVPQSSLPTTAPVLSPTGYADAATGTSTTALRAGVAIGRRGHRGRAMAAAVTAALLGLTAGCGGGSDGGDAPVAPRVQNDGTAVLKSFTGENACANLERHIEDSLIAELAASLENQRRWSTSGNGYTESPIFTPAPTPAAGSAASSFSSTTVRTEGIDEADTVRNDGRRILSLKNAGNDVVLSRVDLGDAGAMALTSQVRWSSGADIAEQADGLYLLDGDRALVLTKTRNWQYAGAILPTPLPSVVEPGPGRVRLRQVDLATAALGTTWEATIPGDLLGSRRIGNRLHVVSQARPALPAGSQGWVDTWSNRTTALSATRINEMVNQQLAANERLIRAVDLATWLAPTGQQGTPTAATCATFSRVDATTRIGFLTLTTIDLDDKTVTSGTALAQASAMYLSRQSLILASPEWSDGANSRTFLHRFVADGPALAYSGSGIIDGRLIDQYAIDETDDGVIRVAASNTTRSSGSFIETLAPATAPTAWQSIGRSDDIAPGETLYAARFHGDRAYLVTFLEVDPFFVYDVADPARPTRLGELKLPGFSTWLRPVGANHVLGIGYGSGWGGEIKASLFDVTDPTAPVEQSALTLGTAYTASEALWDPHAFTWYSPAEPIAGLPSGGTDGTFAIPIRGYANDYSPLNTSAVRLISVRPGAGSEGLTLNGSIDLSDLLATPGPGASRSPDGWRGADARRAVFVGTTAYAIADGVIRSAPIASPASTLSTLILP